MMCNEEKKTWTTGLSVWLKNLYYFGTIVTLCLIMVQVFIAKRSMMQSSDWEKAKMTIENVERFKENLKSTMLYKHQEALQFSIQRRWPDLTKKENKSSADTLRIIYSSLFDVYDYKTMIYMIEEDIKKTTSILDAFAYPIIMGYANELGSYQNLSFDYISFGNYMMFMIHNYGSGVDAVMINARLLFRLWKVRFELDFFRDDEAYKKISDTNHLLCFEETELTAASQKRYEKKLQNELKKIQKEIEDFRKSSMK